METFSAEFQCHPGDEVYGIDDHKLGKVVAADSRYLTVEHGLLSKSHYYIPTSAVNAWDDGKVYLDVPKDAVGAMGWDAPPPLPTEADGVPVADLTPPGAR